jgi:hypothetical protein
MGVRRYSSYSFTTSALNRGEWSASRPGRALTPGKGPPVPIVQEAGWAPEPVWTQRLEEKSFALSGDRTPCHWDKFFSEFFVFSLAILFHRGWSSSCIIWGIKNRSVGVAGNHSSETYLVKSTWTTTDSSWVATDYVGWLVSIETELLNLWIVLRHFVWPLDRSQCPYIHSTTQHRRKSTHVRDSVWTWTHDPRFRANKTHCS